MRRSLSHAYQALGRIFNERDREFKPISMKPVSIQETIDLVSISRDQYEHYQKLKIIIDEVRSEL